MSGDLSAAAPRTVPMPVRPIVLLARLAAFLPEADSGRLLRELAIDPGSTAWRRLCAALAAADAASATASSGVERDQALGAVDAAAADVLADTPPVPRMRGRWCRPGSAVASIGARLAWGGRSAAHPGRVCGRGVASGGGARRGVVNA
jgi:hypothetical protein